MQKLIGRKKELQTLQAQLSSQKSEFVAVYGRRRVGKTFLIRRAFNHQFTFHVTGLAKVGKRKQLTRFHASLLKYAPDEQELIPANDWFAAFDQLEALLERKKTTGKKIVFLDEVPWLATRGSHFISALEGFWNDWASARDDILLIVCGSAASWMIKNLINNKGGLHNRITRRVKLEPFTLAETEVFLKNQHAVYDRYQIILLYMVFGGIPFYLEQIQTGLSAMQNINELCFERNAPFREEYNNLYASLFKKSERHIAVIEALAQKNKGLSRTEIIKLSQLSDGGGLTRILKELEESSFIRSYQSFQKKGRHKLYQLVDLYSLFYLNFIKNSSSDDENFWINAVEAPMFRTWSGYAFEMVCLHHVKEIKMALGISGVQTSVASWASDKAQIDLLIDRKDHIINLCEMKFSIHPFNINKKYADSLRNKIANFKAITETKKAVFLTMITTYGLLNNKYASMVQNDLRMDILFEK